MPGTNTSLLFKYRVNKKRHKKCEEREWRNVKQNQKAHRSLHVQQTNQKEETKTQNAKQNEIQ